MNLLGDTPGTEPQPKRKTGFGFYPMVELRRDPPRPGRLVEVDEAGEVVTDSPVVDNEATVQSLTGAKVVIPPGFPTMLERLEAVGAVVTVHRQSVGTPKLAEEVFSDVIWV